MREVAVVLMESGCDTVKEKRYVREDDVVDDTDESEFMFRRGVPCFQQFCATITQAGNTTLETWDIEQ
jgi:hypothetical protein